MVEVVLRALTVLVVMAGLQVGDVLVARRRPFDEGRLPTLERILLLPITTDKPVALED
ncbi:MAG: hypothetical protein IPG43_11520 [Proteobacteria bacterium]|nr:hypothetical protein [Pseudomonadota bacterium]